MVRKETEEQFLKEYREYLNNEYSHLSKSTLNTYFIDGKTLMNGDRGSDFWLTISDRELADRMKDTNLTSWQLWTDIHSESATAINGTNAATSLDRMYDFCEANKEFAKQLREETKELSKFTVKTIIDLYDFSDLTTIKRNLSIVTGWEEEYFDKYIKDYEFLLGKTDDVYRLNIDTLYYFLDTFKDDELDKVFDRLDFYLRHSAERYLNLFPYRYDELTEYAQKRGSQRVFDKSVMDDYKYHVNHDLENSYWVIHKKGDNLDYDYRSQDSKTWVNEIPRFANRVNYIPIGAQFIFVEEIEITDEYQKFFDKGLKILAKGVVVKNYEDGKRLDFKWNTVYEDKIWYRDQFTADLALIRSDKSWARRNFVNFLNGVEEQDIDRYIKAYGKKTSKAEIIEEQQALIIEGSNLEEVQDTTYTEENFLDEVFIDRSEYQKINSLLSMKQNIVLQGAPGVGKTFMAKRLAYSRIGNISHQNVKQIQFHQSYSYEDLIMGYRPTDTGFEIKTGPFYDFCMEAIESPEEEFYFIIDEINRGNISKIFGELLMLIESDKRGPKNAIKLMYSDEEFYVPKNIYIIGLMNTADRSLAVMDYALRRRFAFYTLKPGFKNKKFKEMIEQTNNKNMHRLVSKVEMINQDILEDDSLGKGFEIGHSYFTFNRELTNMHVNNIIEYEIIPLLEEYWYDSQSKVDSYSVMLREIINE